MSGNICAPVVSAVPYALSSVPRFGSVMLTTVPVTPLVRLAVAAASILSVTSGVNPPGAACGAGEGLAEGGSLPGEHAPSRATHATTTSITAARRGTRLYEIMISDATRCAANAIDGSAFWTSNRPAIDRRWQATQSEADDADAD